jgi:hypothetical protein
VGAQDCLRRWPPRHSEGVVLPLSVDPSAGACMCVRRRNPSSAGPHRRASMSALARARAGATSRQRSVRPESCAWTTTLDELSRRGPLSIGRVPGVMTRTEAQAGGRMDEELGTLGHVRSRRTATAQVSDLAAENRRHGCAWASGQTVEASTRATSVVATWGVVRRTSSWRRRGFRGCHSHHHALHPIHASSSGQRPDPGDGRPLPLQADAVPARRPALHRRRHRGRADAQGDDVRSALECGPASAAGRPCSRTAARRAAVPPHAYSVVKAARCRGKVRHRTLVVGAGQVGTRLARTLLDRRDYGLEPIGFVDSRPSERLPSSPARARRLRPAAHSSGSTPSAT